MGLCTSSITNFHTSTKKKIKMSNLCAIFLFVSFLVLGADAVDHCIKGPFDKVGGPDKIECDAVPQICKYTKAGGTTSGAPKCVPEEFYFYPCKTENDTVCFIKGKEKKKCFEGDISSPTVEQRPLDAAICKYTPLESGDSHRGSACVAEDFYEYPCKNETTCFIKAAEAKPTEEQIKKLCKAPPACKEKKKCVKGDISSSTNEVICKLDAAICQYTPLASGDSFDGNSACVAEDFYDYPCKNETICFINAAEAKHTGDQIKETCKAAPACKGKKKCVKGDISSSANVVICKLYASSMLQKHNLLEIKSRKRVKQHQHVKERKNASKAIFLLVLLNRYVLLMQQYASTPQ